MLWGQVADSSRFGRKTVLLIGLAGTRESQHPSWWKLSVYCNANACVILVVSSIGFGFSTTFWQALLFRCLGGITNGNVGVLRTM
jgi:hypothetical protein